MAISLWHWRLTKDQIAKLKALLDSMLQKKLPAVTKEALLKLIEHVLKTSTDISWNDRMLDQTLPKLKRELEESLEAR